MSRVQTTPAVFGDTLPINSMRQPRPGIPVTPPLPRTVARDPRLSHRDRGLVAELWSHIPGHTWTTRELWESTRPEDGSPNQVIEGRDALYAIVGNLRDVGYVVPVAELTPHGWEVRYALHRAAAPLPVVQDEDGFVFVPWGVLRDRSMSYRARGLLVTRLAHGRTDKGRTWDVVEGGLSTLAGRPPDGLRATRTAYAELELLGYAARRRVKNPTTGRFSWQLVFRSWSGEFPQVSPQVLFQEGRSDLGERDETAGQSTSPFPGSSKESSGVGEEDQVPRRPVTAVSLGDAREGGTPSATKSKRDAGSQLARHVLFRGLPEHVREDAPIHVLNAMGRKLDRMIEDFGAEAIVMRSREMPLDVAGGRHLAMLERVRISLWGDALAGDQEAVRGRGRVSAFEEHEEAARDDLSASDGHSVAEENPITEEGDGEGGHGTLCAVHGDARRLEDGSCLPCSLRGRKPNTRPCPPAHRR